MHFLFRSTVLRSRVQVVEIPHPVLIPSSNWPQLRPWIKYSHRSHLLLLWVVVLALKTGRIANEHQ